MSAQHLLCVVAVLAVLLQVNAHTYLSSVSINGVKQTNCLRPLGTNSPISSVTSAVCTLSSCKLVGVQV